MYPRVPVPKVSNIKVPKIIPLTLFMALICLSHVPASARRNAIATLSEADKVERKALGEVAYKPIQSGEDLYYGDLLIVRIGGKGVIRCYKDSTTWPLPADGLPRGVTNTCP